jgi:hypothetical protein
MSSKRSKTPTAIKEALWKSSMAVSSLSPIKLIGLKKGKS